MTDCTLQRFFSGHFSCPFLGVILGGFHGWSLHLFGSSCAGGIGGGSPDRADLIWWADGVCLVGVLGVLAGGALLWSDSLHHSDNWSGVDRLATPAHIVPEWYFLPFYAMLRASASKWFGVLLMAGGVGLLGCTVSGGSTVGGHASVSGLAESAGISSTLLVLAGLGAALPVYPFTELGALLTGGMFASLQ